MTGPGVRVVTNTVPPVTSPVPQTTPPAPLPAVTSAPETPVTQGPRAVSSTELPTPPPYTEESVANQSTASWLRPSRKPDSEKYE